jgi:hypothetical protein
VLFSKKIAVKLILIRRAFEIWSSAGFNCVDDLEKERFLTLTQA